jgi:hypothetical protein
LQYILSLLLFVVTYSMEQSLSWEANWFSASQEIPHIVWHLKVQYRTYKCLPPVPFLSQIYLFVVNNRNKFKLNSDVHHINIRQKCSFLQPS